MTQCSIVVPETNDVNEIDFHAKLLVGLARAEKRVGQKALAYIMDVTVKQLANIRAGASTHPKRLFDALAADASVLDDVAALYGLRLVPADAACTTDRSAAPALVTALHAVVVAEADGTIDHGELLSMESALREAGKDIDRLLARITAIRSPRAVA